MAAYTQARRTKAPSSVLDAHAHRIGAALVPTVQRIYHDIQRAIRFLQALPCPDLPELPRFEQRETAEFTSFMGHINNGGLIAMRDTVKRAAQGLTAREDAAQLAQAVVRCGDRVARARARLEGHIVTGCIDNLQRTRVAPRKFRIEFDLVSTQRTPRVRPGDEIYWADDTRLGVEVTSYQFLAQCAAGDGAVADLCRDAVARRVPRSGREQVVLDHDSARSLDVARGPGQALGAAAAQDDREAGQSEREGDAGAQLARASTRITSSHCTASADRRARRDHGDQSGVRAQLRASRWHYPIAPDAVR